MLQNRKLQVLTLAILVGGFWIVKSKTGPASNAAAKLPKLSQLRTTAPVPMRPSLSTIPSVTSSSSINILNKNSRLEIQVQAIADTFNRPDIEIPSELTDTSRITLQERHLLRLAVTNQNLDGSSRRASLFLLSKIGVAAMTELGEIAATPIPKFANTQDPHSVGNMKRQFEVSLRITSLESLDKMTGHSQQVLPLLNKVINGQNDRTLVFLASISAGGIQDGKPGKLGRAMNEMIKEAHL
ncbi:hypothetical protein ACLVWU_05230 [Bdellovibrio sp. HCB290]|uniref:hypothetical protein n=1 Tax=Bdellovibrio sp. HCB290 TaxID=3394356 RepID=UPI0039B61471